MSYTPAVSIIINTDGRAKSLAVTLESLRHLHYRNFEVIVVYGPTPDGTKELLEQWSDEVKIGHIPRRNLSESRNISLAMAAGEIVAFLDDDSIPEPEWLTKVTQPFIDPHVAAAGGFLYDHTGVTYQWRFGTADRTGSADENWERAAPEFNFPYTRTFPHVMANSAFRLKALLDIGGFDEQYVYFLDETDAICRLVDAGWKIVQMAGAPVHHKFLASHLRNDARILTSWYLIIRSKIYFALVNAQGHHDINAAINAAQAFARALREGLEWHISEGRADRALIAKFEEEYGAAMRSGLEAGLKGDRTLYDAEKLGQLYQEFKPFPTIVPDSPRLCICLLSRWYPPGSIGGIGRYVHELATSLAALGHQVHVLTEIDGDTVDFEHGVWVHRRRKQHHEMPARARDIGIPQHIWDYSASMHAVATGIAVERPIDAVIAPIWDCEGVAFLLDKRWPLLTSLHTTLASYLDAHAHLKDDVDYQRDFARPMLELERVMLTEPDGIVANSQGIVDQIQSQYDVVLDRATLAMVPHGLSDWSLLPAAKAASLPRKSTRLLFVGRLEERKGIDVLLAALKVVLPDLPDLHVDLVGNDRLPSADGATFKDAWLHENADADFRSRVTFHGEVDEETLRGLYAAADIFVAPSRFESFGLIFVEAMMFAKPVIGCRAGGIPEVVIDGETGLLVEPGDVEALTKAIVALASDAKRRRALGTAGRKRYARHFAPEPMARGMLAALIRFASRQKKAAVNA